MFKNLQREFKRLCLPSKVYFLLSLVGLISIVFQNNNSHKYCVGSLECDMVNSGNFVVFVVKALYVIFWTWLLNIICQAGHKNVSWFLVLLPFILFFILVSLMLLNQ